MNCPTCGAADFYASIFNGSRSCFNPACEYGPKTPKPVAVDPCDLCGAHLTADDAVADGSLTMCVPCLDARPGPAETRTEMELLCSTFDIDAEVTYGAHNRPPDPDWQPYHSWRVSLTRENEHGSTLVLETDFFGGANAMEPTAADVLHCLVSDTWGVRCCDNDFEEWCGNYGYESDSRKAEAVFNTCMNQADEVEDFLYGIFDQFTDAEH